MNKEKLRTRFAPSPTGILHIGGARTALFNYLVAKKSGGTFVLRTEDTDDKRSIEEFATEQHDSLTWLGLVPDESIFEGGPLGPYRQTQRLAVYKQYVDLLLAKKGAYYCFCSKEELEAERSSYIAISGRLDYKYSRRCLQLTDSQVSANLAANKAYVVRFLVSTNKVYSFEDEVRGTVKVASEEMEDFVVCRWNGIPLLNFAVVIDDHLMQISHVLRAEEHLTNTSKQIALYEFFGWQAPHFAHLSIIVNADRKKISKRDKDNKFHSVQNLREMGYLPEGVLNYLLFLGWNTSSTQEFFSLAEMVTVFSTADLNNRSPIFTLEKLNWFNNYWIRKISDQDYEEHAWKFMCKYYALTEEQKGRTLQIAQLFREQLNYFADLPILSNLFFSDTSSKLGALNDQLVLKIENVAKAILALESWNEEALKQLIKTNFKAFERDERKVLFATLREMITGSHQGPQLSAIINLLGKQEFKSRLSKNLNL